MSIYSEYVSNGEDNYIIFNKKDIGKPGFVDEFMQYEDDFHTFPMIRIDTRFECIYVDLLDFAQAYLDADTRTRLFNILNSYLREKLSMIQELKVV